MNSAYPPQQHSSPPPPQASMHYREPPLPPPSNHQHQYTVMPHVPQQSYGPGEPAAAFPPLAPGTRPDAAEPPSRSCVENGRRYELRVIQQPKRARMCGFGDKDRRPITPPPCVQLLITDVVTGKDIDCNEIDHSMFVLNVDLWSPDGSREVNLVKHSATSPSISSTTPVSYQHMSDSNSAYSTVIPGQNTSRDIKPEGSAYPSGSYNPFPNTPSVNPYGQNPQQPTYTPAQTYNSAYPPTNGSQAYPPQNGAYGQTQQPPYYPGGPAQTQLPGYQSNDVTGFMGPVQGRPINNANPVGMYTRNLIGSLSASAFRLSDPGDHIGIWFVLQDLSVRTEGNFRLRFSFVNVGIPATPSNDPSSSAHHNQHPPPAPPQVNKGKAQVLASCFSEVFTVFSAKRFPGVVESTGLSRCFATQGIKIPIRKDGTGKGGRDMDYDED